MFGNNLTISILKEIEGAWMSTSVIDQDHCYGCDGYEYREWEPKEWENFGKPLS